MWSHWTMGTSFKGKQGFPNLKVQRTCLLLVFEVWDAKPTFSVLEPFLRGDTWIGILTNAYYSWFVVGCRSWGCKTNLSEIIGWESFDVAGFDLGFLL